MKKKYQNAFFIFGIIVLALMASQLDFAATWNSLKHAGYWFLAVVALWLFLYIFNTASWYLIINSQYNENNQQESSNKQAPIKFWWLYKITMSGFALNYATPGGLMGGEPYRIMELSPRIGAERASSSVILYVMTHIFSHFWFWLLSCILFVMTQTITIPMALLLLLTASICLLVISFFLKGYRKGLAVKAMNILRHVPWVKKWAFRFIETHQQQLNNIDKQIAALHNQNHKTFFLVVLLEVACRILSALEVLFILLVLYPQVNYINCILIIAFTTLFANLLFFMPLQLGGREGGFLMSATGLGLTSSAGIFVALIVRIRELIWTGIGLLLIKLEKKEKN